MPKSKSCHHRCINGNPLHHQYCQCACQGRMHGAKSLKGDDLVQLAHHKLSDPDITRIEETKWVKVLELAAELDRRPAIRKLRRIA